MKGCCEYERLPFAYFPARDRARSEELEVWEESGLDIESIVINLNGEAFTLVRFGIILDLQGRSARLQNTMLYRLVPAVIPVEVRLQETPYRLDCAHIAEQEVAVPKDAYDVLTKFGSYTPPPPGLKEIYQVHPVFVAKWTEHRIDTLWQIYKINDDMVDYEMAALFLWWSTIPEEFYQLFRESKLHLVKLQERGSELGELLEACRQQAACSSGDTGERSFYWLRKYKNLSGRRFETCDVQQEKARYHPAYSYRTWGRIGEVFRRDNYLAVFREEAEKVANEMISKMKFQKVDNLQQWWKKRLNMVASGSSSRRHLLDNYIKRDERITKSDRPNKKAVIEAVDESDVYRILCSKPCMVARRSTKHEPGLKQRALYAVNDEAVTISAFVSQGMEKNMNFGGMCPLQRPIDVLNWWKSGKQRYGTQVWLSADYTDFNKEHSTNELSILNLAIAKAWLTRYPDEKVASQKALASIWVSRAQWNRYVKDEENETWRVFSALFSGSRDTARDNTLLHLIYHRMIVRWLNENCIEWGTIDKAFMCGDDEDVIASDTIAAAHYYAALLTLGWHANDSKQMCGYSKHEFLQKFPHKIQGCVAPVTSMIAALCSGQWYTKPGLQQDNAVAAMSDQLWELVVRGASCKRIYLIGIDLLNDYMQIKNEREEKVKLEWWKMRMQKQDLPVEYISRTGLSTNPSTFLWYYPGVELEENRPSVGTFYVAQDAHTLPHKASQSWCDRWFKQFEQYGKKDLFNKYVCMMKAASYGSLYHNHLQQEKKKWILAKWPIRTSITKELYATAAYKDAYHSRVERKLYENATLIEQVLMAHGSKTEVETIPQKLAKVGADMLMFELLGGERNIELCHELKIYVGRTRKKENWLDLYPTINEAYTLLDPALRSFLVTTGPQLK